MGVWEENDAHVPISTHALTEGDAIRQLQQLEAQHFNSRPHGGRRHITVDAVRNEHISTHALTEGDQKH